MRTYKKRIVLALAVTITSIAQHNFITATVHETRDNPDIPEGDIRIENDKPITNGLYGRKMEKKQIATARIVQSPVEIHE
jgi:hypothetical protein